MPAPKPKASDTAAATGTTAAAASTTTTPTTTTFDSRLAALEAVAAELEAGDLPLERAIERYQHGIELLKQCQHDLDGYKHKVEELAQQAEGALRSDAPRDVGSR